MDDLLPPPPKKSTPVSTGDELLPPPPKKKDVAGGESSTQLVQQDTAPSTQNGVNYTWNNQDVYKAPLAGGGPQGVGVNKNNFTGTEERPLDYVARKNKEAHKAMANADNVQFEARIIADNPKVQQASDLKKQIDAIGTPVTAAQKLNYNKLAGQYNDLLKQPASIPDDEDWSVSVNGRPNPQDILKDKTVGDAFGMLGQRVDDHGKHIQTAQDANAEVNRVIGDVRKAGNFSLTPGKDFKELGAWQNFFYSAGQSTADIFDGVRYLGANDEERKQMMKARQAQDLFFPTQPKDNLATKLSGMAGGTLPYLLSGGTGAEIALASGAAKGTIGAMITNSAAMGVSGYVNGGYEGWQQALAQGMDENEALKVSNNMALTSGATGTLLGAVTPGGALSPELRTALLQAAKKTTLLSGMFAGSRLIENKIAQTQGLDRDTFDQVMQRAQDGAMMGVAFDALHLFREHVPPATAELYKNVLAKYGLADVQQAVNNASAKGITDSKPLLDELVKRGAAFNAMPDVPFDKQQEVAPQTERLIDLKEQAKKSVFPEQGNIAEQESLSREINEKLGTPLTEQEQKEFHDLKQMRSDAKSDPEADRLSPLEKGKLKHYEARQAAIDEADEDLKDRKILKLQKKSDLPTSPEIPLSDEAKGKLDLIEQGKIVTNEQRTITNQNLQPVVDELQKNLKALTETRDNGNRRFTRGQIDDAIKDIKNKITTIEDARKSQGVAEPINFKQATNEGPATVDTTTPANGEVPAAEGQQAAPVAEAGDKNVVSVGSHATDGKDRLVSGKTGDPITEKGKAQAEKQGEELKAQGVTKIITPTEKRNEETAGILAEKTGAKVETNDNFAPLDIGDFNGLKEEDFAPIHKWFVAHPDATKYEPLGQGQEQPETYGGKSMGESINQHAERVAKGLEEVKQNNPDDKVHIVGNSYTRGVINAIEKNGGWNDAAREEYKNNPRPDEIAVSKSQEARTESQDNTPPSTPKGEQEPPVPPTSEPAKTEPVPPESKVTSLKNAVVDKEREERGLEPAMQAAHKEFGETWDEAMKRMEHNPYAQQDLIDQLENKARPLTDVENAMLLHRQITLQNESDKLSESVNKWHEDGDEAKAQEDRLRLAVVSDALQNIYNIGREAGTENARGLATRRMLVNNDYSLAAMETKKRAALGGRPLTEPERAVLQKQYSDVKEANDKLEARVTELEKQVKTKTTRQVMADLAREARAEKRKATLEQLKTERGEILASIKATLQAPPTGTLALSSSPLVNILPDVAKLAKNYAATGITKMADLVDNIHADLVKLHPTLTKDDVEEAIVDSRRLDALKGRTVKNTAQAIGKTVAGDFSKKPAPRPVPLDAEALRLKAKFERAKDAFEQGLEKDRLANRTTNEKVQDDFVKWQRGYKLSNPITVAKLLSAALLRQTATPLEEGYGGIISKIPGISKIAGKAAREGGLNIKAEAKAVAQGFTTGMKDAYQVMTTGKSDLDVLYGKRGKNALPPEAIEMLGTMHSMLKTTAKRNEFERSFAKRTAWKMKNGIDVSDPLIEMQTGVEAYKDANRAIFMQDNAVSTWWTNSLAAAERNKEFPKSGKAIATLGRFLLPFVKVPTNIVGETLTYAGGAPVGAVRMASALIKGVDKLSPEDADSMMRQVKKGSLGAALLTLGYLSPDAVGGYYQQGVKRDPKDVKPGGLRLFGTNIPPYLVHNPLLEALQLGSTIRRVSDHYLKNSKETQGPVNGLFAAGLGLAEEVPLIKEPLQLTQLFDPKERGYFLGELAKNTADPALLQKIAEWTDKDKEGNPIKRTPANGFNLKSIYEHVEAGVPGLREKLSDKKYYTEKVVERQKELRAAGKSDSEIEDDEKLKEYREKSKVVGKPN